MFSRFETTDNNGIRMFDSRKESTFARSGITAPKQAKPRFPGGNRAGYPNKSVHFGQRFDHDSSRLPSLSQNDAGRRRVGLQVLSTSNQGGGIHYTPQYAARNLQTKYVSHQDNPKPKVANILRASTRAGGFDSNLMLLGSRSNTSLDASPSHVHLPRPMTQAGEPRLGGDYERQLVRPKTQQSYLSSNEMGVKPIRIGVPKLSKKEITFAKKKSSPQQQYQFHMHDLNNPYDNSLHSLPAQNSSSSFDFPKRSFKTQKIKNFRRKKTPLFPQPNDQKKLYNLRSDIQSSDVLFVSSQSSSKHGSKFGRSTLYQLPTLSNAHGRQMQDKVQDALREADRLPEAEAINLLENTMAQAEEYNLNTDRVQKKLVWFQQRHKIRQEMIASAAAGNDAHVDELIERASFYNIGSQDEAVRQARLLLSKTAAWTGREGTDVVVGGKRILNGKYEVLQIVGEGAYGMVMRCRMKGTGNFVAIKEFKISAEDPDAEEVRKSSIREVKLLKFLQHENIVQYLDDFTVGEKIFMVMEFVPRNLLEVLEEHEYGLPKHMTRKIIYQLCKAISFIHSHGFIYRDIKPENLLIDEEGNVKLCDFGFGRHLQASGDDSEDLTDYVATRWYRAPELLLGPPFENDGGKIVRSAYGPEIDIWAIGCLMAELIDGEPLFAGDSDIDQLEKIQKALGRITSKQMKMFLINPANAGYCFPFDNEPLETLKERYGRFLNPNEEDFLVKMLKMDPDKRPTGENCLGHAYFAEMR
ncbi:dual specificity protein kinase [Chloropicon primus]|uniref:cyclin-dependent kinase n=1 Tax=Chloropicon primus TaxID=1764295 RepID=A0A5B8MGZ1_9CHLO|nr:dual specificity protein kinase [Chloropicon primus]|eukprot:QDZ19716.1 dual specificity protein kinase [Chloropicon primus]